jgi:hypothetical protein
MFVSATAALIAARIVPMESALPRNLLSLLATESRMRQLGRNARDFASSEPRLAINEVGREIRFYVSLFRRPPSAASSWQRNACEFAR